MFAFSLHFFWGNYLYNNEGLQNMIFHGIVRRRQVCVTLGVNPNKNFTVGSRSLRDHTFKIFDFNLWGGLGNYFRVRIQFGQALSKINIFFYSSPPLLADADAATVLAAHWLHGKNHSWVLACVRESLNQRSNPLLPTCHLHYFCVDAPKQGPEGTVRRLVLGAACMDAHASSQLRPLPLPLPLPAPWAASPSAASHGLSAEQPASQLVQGLRKRVRGLQPGHSGSSFKPPSKLIKIIYLSPQILFGQCPENY